MKIFSPRRVAVVALAVVIGAGASAALSTPPAAHAGTNNQQSIDKLGKKLVTDYYKDLVKNDNAALEKDLDKNFLSVTLSGIKNKSEVMAILDSYTFSDPVLKDFSTTSSGNEITVVYNGSLVTTPPGTVSDLTKRVNIFVRQGGKWKGIIFVDLGIVPVAKA